MLNVKIYQINSDRDENNVSFMRYDSLERFQGSSQVNSSIYDKVWEGPIEGNSLESVYSALNQNHPFNYYGHSLSVSDVVEVVDSTSDVKLGFYFCDSFGFKTVEFEPEKTKNLEMDKIKVVFLQPDKTAQITEIASSLPGKQRAVQGGIEVLYPFDEDVCIVCNRDGKNDGLPLNRSLRDEESGEILDIIAGNAFICDCSGETLGSLSDEQLNRYEEKFRYPEQFFRLPGGKIFGEKYLPEKKEPLDSLLRSAMDKSTSGQNNGNVPSKESEPDR